jgi:hypothetical protein
MAVTLPFNTNRHSPTLLPQAPVGSLFGFCGQPKRIAVLPVATGQTSIAAAGKAITVYAVSHKISVLR